MNQTPRSPIDEALALFDGSQAALAEAAGVTRQALHKAIRSGRFTPEMATSIDRATDGQVSKYRLVFGDEPKAIRIKRRRAA